MGNLRLPGMWLEYLLIGILIVIVIATAYQLFGEYLSLQTDKLCLQYGLPCPGVPTATPTPETTPTPTVIGMHSPPLRNLFLSNLASDWI